MPIKDHLKSVDSEDLNIGEFETDPDELKALVLESEEALDSLIDKHNETLEERRKKLAKFQWYFPEKVREKFKYNFERKRNALSQVGKIRTHRHSFLTSSLHDEKDSLSKFEAKLSLRKQEIMAKLGNSFFFRKTFPVLFPYAARKRHTFLLGSSGSGKSELVKVHIYHDTLTKPGSLLIEPHGDLALDCSRFKTAKTEIIYISPEYGKLGYYPRYNPFDHKYHTKPLAERQAFISVKAQELMNGFEIVMGTDFSPNMQRIIYNILQVLLFHKGMNINDFMRFLRPATSKHYEKLATLHPNENVRLFFKHDFDLKGLSITKQSVLTRFENCFSNYHLSQIFDCKESSFKLAELLDAGKCVLVNCSQGILGEYGAKVLGSFLFSEVTTHALQRASVPPSQRRAIFTYVDECQNFITERVDKVLSEARKYGLHLLLACQYLGQIESIRLRGSILANSNIKITGLSSARDFEKMSKELSYESKKVPRLGAGKFIVKVGTFKPIIFQAYDFLVKKSGPNYLDKEAHRQRLNETLRKYYVKSKPAEEVERENRKKRSHGETPILPIPNPEKLL